MSQKTLIRDENGETQADEESRLCKVNFFKGRKAPRKEFHATTQHLMIKRTAFNTRTSKTWPFLLLFMITTLTVRRAVLKDPNLNLLV